MKQLLLFFFTTIVLLTASVNAVHSAGNAVLSLSPASTTVTSGQVFTVDVILNTGGAQSSGADVMLTFDNQKLALSDITPGTIFDQYVGKTIDNAKGTAMISGLASSAEKLFSGTGTFAVLRFQAVGSGTSSVSFVFTPGNLNDSNVADFASTTDALSSVSNGSFTISGTGGSGLSPTSKPTTPSQLPVTSDSLITGVLAVLSGIFVVIAGVIAKVTGS